MKHKSQAEQWVQDLVPTTCLHIMWTLLLVHDDKGKVLREQWVPSEGNPEYFTVVVVVFLRLNFTMT